MKVQELFESDVLAPILWDMVKQRLEKGEPVFVKISEFQGSYTPDRLSIAKVVGVGVKGKMHVLYYRRDEQSASGWFEVLPDGDTLENLKLTKHKNGKFMITGRGNRGYIRV